MLDWYRVAPVHGEDPGIWFADTFGIGDQSRVKHGWQGKALQFGALHATLGLLLRLALQIPGTEIERPLAIVMIGGLVTSVLFTLLVLPTFYLQVHGWLERRSSHAEEGTA